MTTKKLHELIELAHQGKKFKARLPGRSELWPQDHFIDNGGWQKFAITADWEYIEYSALEAANQRIKELEATASGYAHGMFAAAEDLNKETDRAERFKKLVDKSEKLLMGVLLQKKVPAHEFTIWAKELEETRETLKGE